jgi:hypothetical protein
MERLAPMAAVDDDFLSDQGQDRTYQTLRHLLYAAGELMSAQGHELAADEAAAPVQQAFVLRMMESTAFVKQLSGVRELRWALRRVTMLPDGAPRDARVQVRGSREVGG